jgi:DNA-directed RNA polymerase specialized sigma24 family protein
MKRIIRLTESDLTKIVKRIINEKKDSLLNDLSLNDLKKYLDVYSDRITEREKDIIRGVYLEGKTIEEFSDKLNFSVQRVKQIIDKGIRRIIHLRDTETDHLDDKKRKIIKMEILDGDVRTLIDKHSKDLSKEEIYKTIRKVLTQY